MDKEEQVFLINLLTEQKFSFNNYYYKSLLNLSAGAFTISISIIQVFHESDFYSIYLLYISWAALISSLASILAYFILTPYRLDRKIKELEWTGSQLKKLEAEEDLLARETDLKYEGKNIKAWWEIHEEIIMNKTYRYLGYSCTIFFIIGIGFLTAFTIKNIS